jgi:nucleotidyltransferase/DNA polymerase involved in DNA repair
MCSELLLSLPSAKSIPGVGSATFKLLESAGLATVQSIQEASLDQLNAILGKVIKRS